MQMISIINTLFVFCIGESFKNPVIKRPKFYVKNHELKKNELMISKDSTKGILNFIKICFLKILV